VRVSSAGELTWEAAADLESGIAEFAIERDGKKLARVPAQHSGFFVGRPTFQQIGYGDEPKWPIPEMRYTDASAKGNKKHTYAVRAVNTVGLESEPSLAVPMTGFSRDRSEGFPQVIISKQWPGGPESLPSRAAIKLDTKLLDVCVGQYEFAPGAVFPSGAKLAIWREGEQLLAQPRSGSETPGAFEIYPSSQTNFFFKLDRSQLTFIKNDQGKVTALIHRSSKAGIPDQLATKVTGPAK
jgi:hypothetical protein